MLGMLAHACNQYFGSRDWEIVESGVQSYPKYHIELIPA